jgi:hypothetical protein
MYSIFCLFAGLSSCVILEEIREKLAFYMLKYEQN